MANKGSALTRLVGLFLLLCGLGGAFYFYAFFDVSVEVPPTTILGTTVEGRRIVNLGLIQDRSNGIIFGFGAAFVGGVLMFVGRSRIRTLAADERKCPFCAEYIKAEAIVCRYCIRSWFQAPAVSRSTM